MSHRALAARNSAGGALQRLVNLVSHRSGAVFSIMGEASVTLPQVLLLSRVGALGPGSASGLALEHGASAPAASQMIERLVRQGLLRRSEDHSDRRRKVIALSAAAGSLLKRLEAARAAEYDRGLAPLDPQLKAQLAALLERAVTALERPSTDRRRSAGRTAREETDA